jgi:hypothetical protein
MRPGAPRANLKLMLRVSFFRPYARAIAICLLLTGGAGFQHSGKDDFACGLGGSSTDGPTLAASTPDGLEHCLVCHWTRSLRSSSALAPPIHCVPAASADVDSRQPARHGAPALDRAPARAPPFSL